ncbi:MAG: sulfatase [Planctomycetaceae bacterium]|nr:sulfatase [Planctomycetaceae bacterium]
MTRRVTRRDALYVGFLGGLGLTLADFLKLREAQAAPKFYESKEGKAKSVIFIFMPGGMCHQETFDPKPLAPLEYRGPMNSIETNVGGVRVNETWKQTAQVMDKITICRSMSHGEAAHERGTHNMFTGYRPSPILQFPSMGSIVTHEFGPRNNLPQYICIPGQPNQFAGTGYLSASYAPFSLGSDPASGGFKVRDLNLPPGIDGDRFATRRRVLDIVNDRFRTKEKDDSLVALDSFYDRAYSMISSPEAQGAFDLSKEDPKLRDEYGRNTAGARLLLARRLVEAGSRFVTLTYGGWDMHGNIEGSIKSQVPAFDQGFAALIRDLDRRGLLDSTLISICSEFGRTPKINGNAGRDHWPKVFSVVLAGGGIKRGTVYGSSNAIASEPDEKMLNVEDWATTIYHCLGIVGDKELIAPGERPIEIVKNGKVRKELLV